jgi:hypothetical protein
MTNAYLAGLLAGLAAVPVWIIMNLLVDRAFLSVIRRHSDQLNEKMLSNPALNLVVLASDVAFWGAIFGLGYALVHSAISWSGALGSGLLWGTLMFLSFSRATVESSLWTKVSKDMNAFWFVWDS